MVHCEKLQCEWVYWAPVSDSELCVMVATDNCPDFSGCIKVAKSLMAGVQKISVWQDDAPARLINVYERSPGKRWVCSFSAPTIL